MLPLEPAARTKEICICMGRLVICLLALQDTVLVTTGHKSDESKLKTHHLAASQPEITNQLSTVNNNTLDGAYDSAAHRQRALQAAQTTQRPELLHDYKNDCCLGPKADILCCPASEEASCSFPLDYILCTLNWPCVMVPTCRKPACVSKPDMLAPAVMINATVMCTANRAHVATKQQMRSRAVSCEAAVLSYSSTSDTRLAMCEHARQAAGHTDKHVGLDDIHRCCGSGGDQACHHAG